MTAAPGTTPPPLARRPGWRARWQAWWWSRLPPSDRLTLNHRNVYNLPTRAGWMLGLTLVLLLLGSINYQLNLGYLLTFLIAGCSVVAMHMSHRNLRGLQLSLQVGESVHAGQALGVRVALDNPTGHGRYGIGLRWAGERTEPVWVDVAAHDSQTVVLHWPAPARGWHQLPPLQLLSRFPLGTFEVWSWWRPASRVLIYPAAEWAAPPLPLGHGPQGAASSTAALPALREDWTGVRPYRRGDPLNELMWKRVARRDDDDPASWVSRDSPPPPSHACWLDSQHCGLSDTEAQRSRLCAWVLKAQASETPYGLLLPGQRIEPALGEAHRRHCLEALACH